MIETFRLPLNPGEANDTIRAVASRQQIADYVTARKPVLIDQTRPNQARVNMLFEDLSARLPLEATLSNVSIDDAIGRIEFTVTAGRRSMDFTA